MVKIKKIKLGNKVRCKITGFEGIATAKVEYINGCIQYCVKPKSIDNKMPDGEYIDVQELDVICEVNIGVDDQLSKNIPFVTVDVLGGPQRDQPKK